MRQITIIVASVAVCFSANRVEAGDNSINVSTTIGFESRYVFRGIQFAETSFQPAINISYGNFYLNTWLNLPVGDDDLTVTPGGEELDLIAGYNAPLNEKLNIDVGVIYYVFPDLASGFFDLLREDGNGLGANSVEAYLGLVFDAPLSPSIYLYRDFFLDTTTLQGNYSHSFPLVENVDFNISGYLGYVFDDAGGTNYLYGTASMDISYALSDNGSFLLGTRYGGSDIVGGSLINNSIAGTTKSSALWWGISFNSTF